MILVIDHAEEMRADVVFFLRLAGHDAVLEVASFSEALTILSAPQENAVGEPDGLPSSDAETMLAPGAVDVILLGADLDDVDVVGACQILASSPQTRLIPVILLRESIPATQIEAALAAGAFDFINMPIFPTELAARITAAQKLRSESVARDLAERELIETTLQLQLSRERYDLLADELRRHSEKDTLTGVYNKRWFYERLGLELRSASRRGTFISLLFLDLDHFSLYNEIHGRTAGDRALHMIATTIKQTLKRSIDAVARVGGEEFAIILPDTDARGATVVASKILALVKTLAIPHERSPVAPILTLSIGIAARKPTPRLSNSTFILAADQQLHQAKKLGRNRYSLSTHEAEKQTSILDKLF